MKEQDDKYCPFTRGNKFGSDTCYRNRCAWWREECGKCAVVSIAEIFSPIQERKVEENEGIDYDSCTFIISGNISKEEMIKIASEIKKYVE